MRTANQRVFTLIAPLHDAEAARKTLAPLPPECLQGIKTLHHARFVVVDATRDPDGTRFGPCLIFVAHYDGDWATFRESLIEHPRVRQLEAVFDHCLDFDEEEGPLRSRVERYLAKRKVE